MATILGGAYAANTLRTVTLGISVQRATAALPTAIQSPQNIFTVTGGRIVSVSLVGEVTTVIGGNAQTLKLSYLASAAGASALDLCTASASIATAAVGTHFGVPASSGSAMVTDIATLSGIPAYNYDEARMIFPAGAVTLTSSATNTGSVKWELIYIPLDDTVVVAAA